MYPEQREGRFRFLRRSRRGLHHKQTESIYRLCFVFVESLDENRCASCRQPIPCHSAAPQARRAACCPACGVWFRFRLSDGQFSPKAKFFDFFRLDKKFVPKAFRQCAQSPSLPPLPPRFPDISTRFRGCDTGTTQYPPYIMKKSPRKF